MGLFTTTSAKTFRVSDSPDVARRIVNRMTVDDGAPNGLPPLVVAGRTSPGHFKAMSPIAMFDSRFEVRSDGAGGSIVTEQKTAGSPIPFFSNVATVIHDVATDPRSAYFRARNRDG